MGTDKIGVLFNNSSIMDIINNISTDGLNELLLAVLRRIGNPVIAWNSLHPSLQRNTNSSLSFSTTIKTEKTTDNRKTNKYVTGSTVSSILPVKIGDVVIRGNDWMYEQQDKDVRAHDGGRAELADVSVGYITGVSLWDPMAVIQSPGASSFSPMQSDRGRPWDLNTGIGIDTGKGDDREKEKGGLILSSTVPAMTNVKKQEGGLRDSHHRAEHPTTEEKIKEKDKDEEEEGERGGLCVTVQWSQGGGVNTYRWGVPIDSPLNPSLPPSPVSGSTNPISLHINTNDRIATSTQNNVVDRYYDVKILALDSEPVEVRRQAQVRTLKHAPQQREVLKYTPGQVHDSLVRGMGDLQAGDVLQYVRDRERMALSTATTVAVATTSSTPTTATASAGAAAVTSGVIGLTGSDTATKVSDSAGNLITTKDIVDKMKDVDKDKDDNNNNKDKDKDKDDDKNGNKNDASLRSSWTPVEIHQIYENYFSRNGIILPVEFSVFTCTSTSNVMIQRDTMSDTFSRLMISLTQLIEAIHVSQTIMINTENIQKSEMKEIGDIKNAQNTDMNINSKILESAQRALLIFQGLIIGSGESPAGKNLLKINVRANDMKNRLANKEFFGSEKIPLKWKWLEGFWNYYSKDSDRKKNHDNTIAYEKGNEYIVTNLLFDSTCVPESLLLSESNRTVHQRWNKRWGSAVGNIVLHPNTGEVMRRMNHKR